MKNLNISQTFIALSHQPQTELTYQEILDYLGRRSFGIAIVLFALPSALPISSIPGVSFLFSLPILFISLQILFAKKTLWLPNKLAKQTITTQKLRQIVEKALPFLKYFDRLLKPRLVFLHQGFFEYAHAFVICILAICLSLPIPLSNFIFAGTIILFGLSIWEKDGLLVLLAYLLTAATLYFYFAIIKQLIKLL